MGCTHGIRRAVAALCAVALLCAFACPAPALAAWGGGLRLPAAADSLHAFTAADTEAGDPAAAEEPEDEEETPAVKKLTTKQKVNQKAVKSFLARKKHFSIACRKTAYVKKLVRRLSSKWAHTYYSALLRLTNSYDDPSTECDLDYLFGCIDHLKCRYKGGKLRFYKVRYFETKRQTKKVDAVIEVMADEIAEGVHSAKRKVKEAYAYAAYLVRYDTRKHSASSAYAGLIKGRTVCNGYAMILYRLLNQLGVPCRTVTGWLKVGKTWELHAWNMVKLKKKWYYVDLTNDDVGDYAIDQFFLKGSKAYKKHHFSFPYYTTRAFKKAHRVSKKNY